MAIDHVASAVELGIDMAPVVVDTAAIAAEAGVAVGQAAAPMAVGLFGKTVELAKAHPYATAAIIVGGVAVVGYVGYRYFTKDKEDSKESSEAGK